MKKYKKIIIISLLICTLCVSYVNCIEYDIDKKIQTICINGVEYYIFCESSINKGYGYMSPKFNRDGSISTCN